MTPEAAVARLAALIAARADFTEQELYAEMADAGIPYAIADRAYRFTQIAWGRVFLRGLGVKFASDYMCFNGAGEVVESGLLADQPCFVAAMNMAKRQPPAGLVRFAMMSAEAAVLDQAIKAGSKPEDLVSGPAAMFTQSPTQEGIERARRTLTESVGRPQKPRRF